MEREDVKEGSLTCHLCGKVQCGQRLGRVTCCRCKRIFCLQQLERKFQIKAVAGSTNFECPRCLGICCCVSDCKKGPPHVHCKVYNVRKNKIRHNNIEPSPHEDPGQKLGDQHPSLDEVPFSNRPFPQDSFSFPFDNSLWTDQQYLWQMPVADIPSRFSLWLIIYSSK